MSRLKRIALAVASGWLAIAPTFLHAEGPTTRPAEVEIAPDAKIGGNKFLRFVDHDRSPLLQTSIVTYQNAKGVRVDLIGAVHIGDRAYYDQLNNEFKNYEVLLYEMVKPTEADPGELREKQKPDFQINMIHSMQKLMQEYLELEFQLDDIDYKAANFVHADLDSDTFLRMQQERGESMLNLMLNAMLKEMSNPSAPTGNEPSLLDILDALQSPDRARKLKIVLATQFQDMDRAMSSLGGESGSVILDERNKHCLKVLREQIDAGKTNIGIFYGAGHYPGMEKLMIDLMGFKQVGEPRWVTAWDMSLKSEADRKEKPAAGAVDAGEEEEMPRPTTRPAKK
jgi:hypothetical protein